MKKHLLLLFFLVISATVFGQKAKEVGLKFQNLNQFNVLYKFGKDADHLTRISGLVGHANYLLGSNNTNRTLVNFGLGINDENHLAITDRFDFIHGIGGYVGYYGNVNNSNDGSRRRVVANFGYLLGGVYDLSNQFHAGVEIMPNVFYQNFDFENNLNQQTHEQYGFQSGTSNASLTFTYSFNK